jgi:cytochrome c oxidase subunit 4
MSQFGVILSEADGISRGATPARRLNPRPVMSDHSKSSPLKMYFTVWAALLVGTFITYKAAFIELGRYNAAVALTIATVKALLVALFFMHIKGAHEKLLKLVVISTVFFLFLLLVLSMADYGTRAWS